MKAGVFFEMSNDELNLKLASLKKDLFDLRFKHAIGQLENANQLNFLKKDIAKVKTILRERELNISKEPIKAVAKKAAPKKAKKVED